MGRVSNRTEQSKAHGPRAMRPAEAPLACLVAGSALPLTLPYGSAPTLALVAAIALLAWAIFNGMRAPAPWRLPLALVLVFALTRTVLLLDAQAQTGVANPFRAEEVWTHVRGNAEHVEGRLTNQPVLHRVAAGVVQPGERIAVLGGRPRLLARGPGPAPGPGVLASGRTPSGRTPSEHGPSEHSVPGREGTGLPEDRPPIARLEVPADDLVRVARAPVGFLDPVTRWLGRVRSVGRERLRALQEPHLGGFLAALVLGERAWLDFGLADLFTRTGTRHLLALSGLHVVLAAALFAWPAGALAGRVARSLPGVAPHRRLAFGRWICAGVRAALVLCFVPLGGGGTSVARAAVAGALAALAPVLPAAHLPPGSGHRIDGRTLWCVALGWELLANPLALGELGVQLSYAATLGLLLGAGRAQRRLLRCLPGQGELQPTGRTGLARPRLLRALVARGSRATCGALAASIVATASTLPVVWLRFGEVSPAGILATPAAVPAVALLLGLGALHACVPLLVPEAWLVPAFRTLLAGLERIDRWPGTPHVLPAEAPLAWLAGLSCGIAWLLAHPPAPKRKMCCLALLAFAQCHAQQETGRGGPPGLEVLALDVGHGTAVLLRSPESGVWLFDAGSRDRLGVARQALLPVLRRWAPTTLTVVASHLDRDHVGALDWIAQRFPVRAWCGALPRSVDRILDPRVPRLDLQAGRALLARQGSFAAWLIRGRDVPGNEGSRMLELRYGQQRILLTGDAEASGLRESLERGNLGAPVDLLLLPHHGSWTEQLVPLLERVRPQRAWASTSKVPAALTPLRLRGIPLESTHRRGPLRWHSSEGNQRAASH